MEEAILLRFFIQGLLVLLSPLTTASNRFFFNETSLIQVSSAVVPLTSGFDLTFRTCNGGVLLSQKSTNNGFFTLEVVPTVVNYSHTPTLFIASHLRMTWEISGTRQFVTVGTKLDQNFNYKVEFVAGSGAINSTLTLTGISSVDVPNSILGFRNSGPLRAGQPISAGQGFVGCIGSGTNIQLRNSGPGTFLNIKNCTLDNQQGCPDKVCPTGFTGDYCEINIDDCAQVPCHHYSTCKDLIGNYSCVCGPRWTGRHCDNYLGPLCNSSLCQNGGHCRETADLNNYTCACAPGYTGRNCEVVFDPCDSSPCQQDGTCSKLGSENFQCSCPSGFKGPTCNVNVNECGALPCSHGSCIDGINSYTCNCTGSGYTGQTCAEDINECETNNPCHPNATCTNYPGTYQCNCQAGFTGKNCYENVDDCRSNPCRNGGSCHDKVSGYICNCTVGFNGSLCENNIDDCVSHTCNNYSLCEDGINNYTCVCKPGYAGVNCTTDINECDSSPCQHGGNCTHGINSYNCSCPERYSGTNCEIDLVDDCKLTNPCFNNATCVDDINKFNCTCVPGYEGPRCETETNECLSSPCLNNGTCIDRFNNFTCNCTSGFTGHRCDVDIDDCVINPCQNNATCVDGINHRTCYCPAEFYGDDCGKVRDPCHPNPCDNNANCSFTANSYNCSCVLGFEGRNCSVNIDDCKNDPCVANATCIDGVNNFTCQCPAGFHGEFCDLEIKECDSNPCKNNGTCLEGIDGYNCSCVLGFNGTHCEHNIDDCPSHNCNNGTCIDGINSFTCSCTSGFTGEFCDSDINECNPNPCNCSTCVNVPGSYRCNCDQWTTGVHCEIDIDECQNQSLCSRQQGFCRNYNVVTDYPTCEDPERKGYECFCKNGFQGHNCEINTDDCASSPCQNGATCNDGVFSYTCTCASGWTGKNCDTDINECDLHVCQNNATCLNLDGTYNCTCKPGFSDFNCSTDIDECESSPCLNGNCTDLVNGFNCTCFPGYTGKNCSEDIDECESSPCINNGTCIDLIADFNCTCSRNYTGKRCETKLTSCVPNPCFNNGSCTPHPENNNYTCECSPGFGGALCENVTTIGLSGSSFMFFQLDRNAFELSFQFRTTLSYGLLAANSQNTFLVFLETENVTIVYNKATKLSVGNIANLSDGHWHTIHINISSGSVSVTVDNSSCGQHCVASSSLQTQVSLIDLYVGGSPFGPSYDHNTLYNFTGCIQDVNIDRNTVIPTGSQVSLVNTSIGCLRREVCASNPCAHGKCVDKWIKYSCECARRWIGPQCNATLIPGSFGATEPLNVASNRRRRDIQSMQNASFAKFLTNRTSFGASGELSFFIRTREHNGLVVFMTDSGDNHIAVVVHEGFLTIQVKLDGVNSNVTLNESINDGEWHFAEVQGNMLHLDNHTQEVVLTGGKSINLTFTFIGGIDDYNRFPDAFLIRTPFRGCLQDIRLNNQLFDFGFTSPSLISMDRYQLLASGHVGEGCKGMNVCRSAPCGVGGYCKDLWNKYQCDCKPRYGGTDCALYGCALVNLCPANTTCRDVGENYECVRPVTLNDSSSSAVFKFTSNVNVSFNVSLRVRTRQPSTSLIDINQDQNTFFKMEVANGRVRTHYLLEGESGLILSDVVVSDGRWHDVVFNVTNNQSHVTVDGSETYNSSRLPSREITGLLQRALVLVGNSVFKGCLDNVRIGGLLLPFVDYYNGTLNVSHVTPLKPHFNATIRGIQLGCHGDDVCAMSPCVRGVCGDVWNQFTCACPEGWAGNVCNLTANMTCAHSPCVNGTCYNLTHVNFSTNENQVSDVGFDMFGCNCTAGFEGKRCENDTKECASGPCQNGGNCTELHLNYNCSCATGFMGRNCQINIDDCADNNCTNNSTCVDGIASYNCSCVDGFNGTFCELDIDECADTPPYGPCNATGTRSCNNTKGNFACDCKQGYFGPLCQYDPSLTCEIRAPCKNGGNCSDNATAFSCSCPAGYNGTLCEFDIHECADLPCMNNGTCIDSHVNKSYFPGYECQCTVDYTGKQCEKLIDLCDKYPCKNNATCERLAYNEYRCNCTEGFGNVNCSGLLAKCLPHPCNSGVCIPLMDSYVCQCNSGYTGRNCDSLINKCDSNPCQNGGTCTTQENSFDCSCGSEWVGGQCEFQNRCSPNPCKNGASCIMNDQFGNFSCVCPDKFTGQSCETQLTSSPPVAKESRVSPYLISGVVVAGLVAISLFILLILVLRKRAGNGTYSPSKEEGQAGRVELDSILKPPPLERLI